jgi:hypothetical protein
MNFAYPNGYFEQGYFENVSYLCYTEYVKTFCNIQEPVYIGNIENEIYNYLDSKIDGCFSEMKKEFENKGYKIKFDSSKSYSVELVPGKISVPVKRKMSIVKNENRKRFENFKAEIQSPVYEMAVVVQEIVSQEALYCNSDYVKIMAENKNIEIKRYDDGNDNKIYFVKNILTGKQMVFAVRGCVTGAPVDL